MHTTWAEESRRDRWLRRSGVAQKLPEISAAVAALLGGPLAVVVDRTVLDRLGSLEAVGVALAIAAVGFGAGWLWRSRLQNREQHRRAAETVGTGVAIGEFERPEVVVGEEALVAVSALIGAIEQGERWIHLEGEPGLGKSTAVREALGRPSVVELLSGGPIDRRLYIDFDAVEPTRHEVAELIQRRFGGSTHRSGIFAAHDEPSIVVLDHCERFFRDGTRNMADELGALLEWMLAPGGRLTVVTIVQGRRLDQFDRITGVKPLDITLARMEYPSAVELFHACAPSAAGVTLVRPLVEMLGCLPRAVAIVARSIEAEIDSTGGRRNPQRVVKKTYKRVLEYGSLAGVAAPGGDSERNVSLTTAVRVVLSAPEVHDDVRRLLGELAHLPDGATEDDLAEIFDGDDSLLSASYHLRLALRVGLMFVTSSHYRAEPIVVSYLGDAESSGQSEVKRRWARLAIRRLKGPDEEADAWCRRNRQNVDAALRNEWADSSRLALHLAGHVQHVPDEDLLVYRALENDLAVVVERVPGSNGVATTDSIEQLILREIALCKQAELGIVDGSETDELLLGMIRKGRHRQRVRFGHRLLHVGECNDELQTLVKYHLSRAAFHHRAFDPTAFADWSTAALALGADALANSDRLVPVRVGHLRLQFGDLARRYQVTSGQAPRTVALQEYATALTYYDLADDNHGRGEVHYSLGEAAHYKQWVEEDADPRTVALQEYATALTYYDLADNNHGRGEVHYSLGEAAHYKQWVEEDADPRTVALQEYATALTYYDLADNNLGRGEVHYSLAVAAHYKQWVEEDADPRTVALQEYATALTYCDLADDNHGRGNVHHSLAKAAHYKQWVEEDADPRTVALQEYATALTYYDLADNNLGRGNVHHSLAKAAHYKQWVEEDADPRTVALQEYATALTYCDLADDNLGRGNVHHSLGEAAHYKQWVEEDADPRTVALQEYATALTCYDLADNNHGRGNVHHSLGEAAHYKQWVEEDADPRTVALQEYATALTYYDLADNNHGRGNVHHSLGEAAHYKQWVEEDADPRTVALQEYATALTYYDLADNNLGRGNVHHSLGEAAHYKQWVEEDADPRTVALQEYATALTCYDLADDNDGRGNVHLDLGRIHREDADQVAAWTESNTSLSCYRLSDSQFGLGLACAQLASIARSHQLFTAELNDAFQAEVALRRRAETHFARAGTAVDSVDRSANRDELRGALRRLGRQQIWTESTDGPPMDLRGAMHTLMDLTAVLGPDDDEADGHEADAHYWLGLLACENDVWNQDMHADRKSAERFHMEAAKAIYASGRADNRPSFDAVVMHLNSCFLN